MSALYNQVLIHYLDKNGKTAVSFMATQNQLPGGAAAYAPLASAFQACSDAAVVAVQFQSTLLIAATPGDGPYCTVFDRGVCFDRNSVTNVQQRQAIVGPKSSLFLPGNININLANTDVLALQSEVQALLGDAVGNPCGAFQRAVRQEAKPAS